LERWQEPLRALLGSAHSFTLPVCIVRIHYAMICLPATIMDMSFPLVPAWGADASMKVAPGSFLAVHLLALSAYDIRKIRLPDMLTLPLIAMGLLAAWWADPASLWYHTASALIGYVVFKGVAHAYRSIRRIDGLGFGDAKLFAAAGAWVGAEALPLVLLCASIIGLMAVGTMWIYGRDISGTTRIPFGPCLASGMWVAWLHGAS
jgi:leader peptidase (prepilin peptidase) / N-methyltransferase